MAHLNWANGFEGATWLVEIGFASAPTVAVGSTTWTNVTGDVRSLTIQTGKSTEIDGYQPGTATIVLGNRDRDYDPNYASSPYVGNLLPMKRVRISLTYNAVTVRKFCGYIVGFPQAYDVNTNDATVTVKAVDGFAVLQRFQMPSLYEYEVRADTPSLWWRMGESAGTTVTDSTANLADGFYSNNATANSRNGLIVGADNAIAFDGTQQATRPFTWPAFPFSVEFWFNSNGATTSFMFPFVISNTAATSIFFGFDNSAPTAQYLTPTFFLASTASGNYNNGVTHHVVATWTTTTAAPTFYIDGVSVGTPSTSGTATQFGSGTLYVPGLVSAAGPPVVVPFIGTLDEVAIYPTTVSGARVAVHYAAGATPFAGLDTGAAISKVLDIAGWPSADRSIETGKSTVTTIDTSGRTALDVIQTIEASEQGRFFIDPAGIATFYNRHHPLTTATSTTSQATFGDSGTELPYQGIGFDSGESFIRNKVVASRAGGSTYTASDATSIAAYLERGEQITGLVNSDDGQMRDLAYWRMYHYSQPIQRIPQIDVTPRHPRSQATMYAALRDLDLVDRVTVKRRPQGIGTAISQDCLIEGIQHELTYNGEWRTSFYLSPAETQSYFRLDDAVFGLLGNNRLAF